MQAAERHCWLASGPQTTRCSLNDASAASPNGEAALLRCIRASASRIYSPSLYSLLAVPPMMAPNSSSVISAVPRLAATSFTAR